jgi:hypothetical protein
MTGNHRRFILQESAIGDSFAQRTDLILHKLEKNRDHSKTHSSRSHHPMKKQRQTTFDGMPDYDKESRETLSDGLLRALPIPKSLSIAHYIDQDG